MKERCVQLNNKIKNEKNDQRTQALKNLGKVKEQEKGKKFKYVVDPSRPRTRIRIEIKN